MLISTRLKLLDHPRQFDPSHFCQIFATDKKSTAMNLPTWTEAAMSQPKQSTDMHNSRLSDRGGLQERHHSQYNQRDLENTKPHRSQTHQGNDFADNSRTSYNKINILNSSGYDKFDVRSGRDIEEIFDAFKYREVCLNSSAKTKLVANFLNKIKDHINKEACLEAEVRLIHCVEFLETLLTVYLRVYFIDCNGVRGSTGRSRK